MKSTQTEDRRRVQQNGEGGQALVEMSLVLPIILVIILGVAELGVIFGKVSSLGYSSREGARTGAALAQGEMELCAPDNRDPSKVDAVLVAAVQRILKSPDSGIDTAQINSVRIFSADDSGGEKAGTVSIWEYAGPGLGPEIDPGPGVARIDFVATQIAPFWQACDRKNGEPMPESIGVTVNYTYDYVTPLPSFINSFANGAFSMTLSETTVMALNPTT